MLTTYYKGSNLLGFNTTLQKFWDMICEIIFCRTVSGISWFFVVLVNILHAVTVLINLSAQINWIDFFFKNIFSMTWRFFSRLKNHLFGCHSLEKHDFLLFFNCDYLILTRYSKPALKFIGENWKKGDFTILNKSLEPNKLL